MPTHEEIEQFLTDEQLILLRKNWRGKQLKLPDTDSTDPRIEAFMTGALVTFRLLEEFKIKIEAPEDALMQMALFFYPPYEPLPDTDKYRASGPRRDGLKQTD